MTERERAVLHHIVEHTAQAGYPPTVRELAAHLGLRSTSGVAGYLSALQRKGYLNPSAGRARAHRPTKAARPQQVSPCVAVPLLGQVAAGVPLLAHAQADAWLQIDLQLLQRGQAHFALRVQGDSMRDAGILPHDIVLVLQRDSAEPQDIVVALLDDSATIKRYVPRADGIWLEPANPEFSPLRWHPEDGSSLRLLGVVVGLCRTYPASSSWRPGSTAGVA